MQIQILLLQLAPGMSVDTKCDKQFDIGIMTRNMTRIDVGLARSYVKLLLSSWKTYMCNLMAWYINK